MQNLSHAKHIPFFQTCSTHFTHPHYTPFCWLNFVDGASKGNFGSSVTGGIICFGQGESIIAVSAFLGNHGTNEYAEAATILGFFLNWA